MKEQYYKTRREAEMNRKTGSIYFVSDKGYYVVPKKTKVTKLDTNYINIILLSLSVLVLFSMLMILLGYLFEMQSIFHDQKMEELHLEKEIALINNDVSSSMKNITLEEIFTSNESTIVKDPQAQEKAKQFFQEYNKE